MLAATTMLLAQDRIVYVGTYTSGASKGIYAFRLNSSTGKTTEPILAVESSNPAFLALHPSGRFLYSANENANGMLSAFATGEKLMLLNSVSSRGAGPCHVSLDRTGKWLFAANYNSGSVAVFPVGADGKLGDASTVVQHSGSSVNRERQEGPHAHEVVVSADNQFVLVPDLGADRVVIYRFDAAKGTFAPGTPAFVKAAPGAGPRHLAFAPDGKFVYVLNELAASITTFRYENGSMNELQTISTLPADFAGAKSGAEIAVHPSGKFLYASNRGHDSIAVFRIDSSKATLTAAGHAPTQGKTPRNFAIDPTGAYLLAANQDSGTVVVFAIDPKTGGLSPTGQVVQIPSPVSLVFASP
ncbi:MAG: lactonase family protein [Acidobacteriia bacterium]|nr:lactonase family protein [Terriglobia bacterium]